MISLCYTELKPRQVQVNEKFVSGYAVFGILPTGYGKSLCYACLPLIFHQLLQKLSGFATILDSFPTDIHVALMRDHTKLLCTCMHAFKTICIKVLVLTIEVLVFTLDKVQINNCHRHSLVCRPSFCPIQVHTWCSHEKIAGQWTTCCSQEEIVTNNTEEQMWPQGVLGDHSPQTLSDTMIPYVRL